MDELRRRLEEAHPRNWETWPALRKQWPWFAALGAIMLLAIPWGIRAEERSLEDASREALTDAGYAIESITFTGRQATIVSNLNSTDQVGAVTALAEMGGVAKVTWAEGSNPVVVATTLPPTSTTATTLPTDGAAVTLTVRDGRIALRGTVPDAGTIREVGDVAADLWGADVVNRLTVDSSKAAYPWVEGTADALASLTMLIDPQLTLDHEGATLTGAATDEATVDQAVQALENSLGSDISIDNKVTITPLDSPQIEILSLGDGTVALEGTVANLDVRRPIVQAAIRGGEELEIANKVRLAEGTADTYVPRRLPDVVTALSNAEQWTLRYDGESLGGGASGGTIFTGNRIKPTAQAADLIALLGGFLEADPSLSIAIEVHADQREGDVDEIELAQKRADAIASQLIRLGIDPRRISATSAAGDGELLRFQLTPADK